MASKRKTPIKMGKSTQTQDSDFKYTLGQTVLYRSGLYTKYKNKEFTIIKRTKEKSFYNWYTIQHEDGYIINVKEDWIVDINSNTTTTNNDTNINNTSDTEVINED
jgi:hypothetical protein